MGHISEKDPWDDRTRCGHASTFCCMTPYTEHIHVESRTIPSGNKAHEDDEDGVSDEETIPEKCEDKGHKAVRPITQMIYQELEPATQIIIVTSLMH